MDEREGRGKRGKKTMEDRQRLKERRQEKKEGGTSGIEEVKMGEDKI